MSIHYFGTSEEIQAQELEHQLSDIAVKWRGGPSNADILVEEYHQVMERLWSLGYHGEGMSLDMELPDNLMPDYYLKYWREKEKEKAKKRKRNKKI